MVLRSWMRAIGLVFAALLSFLGLKSATAQVENFVKSSGESDAPRIVQNCYFPGEYARVSTRNTDLNVRQTPGGRIVGSIPRGWEVLVRETDRSGRWVFVTSHYGSGSVYFGSAPNFNEGWVSADYLTFLGSYCDKPSMGGRPMNNKGMPPKPYYFMESQLETQVEPQRFSVYEDWTTLGDRISKSLDD
ncbi:SH3 domain-containing protein [Geitlerinema sp. CS-897]|nr:SH3 domain-containing protein [Geitlerinema sp. CS-897]